MPPARTPHAPHAPHAPGRPRIAPSSFTAPTTAPTECGPGVHRFVVSAPLRRRVEAERPRGRWGSVTGIVDHNDRIAAAGGFKLAKARDGATSAPAPTRAADTGDGDGGPPAPPPNGWQELGRGVTTVLLSCPPAATGHGSSEAPVGGGGGRTFNSTVVAVAHCDTLSAALALGDRDGDGDVGGDADGVLALNFANAEVPGGRYRFGARAQEEDLCRLLPELYPALKSSGAYPIPPDAALVTTGLRAVRQPGSYRLGRSRGEVGVITAAMPCGIADRRPKGGFTGPASPWRAAVTVRIRAVLSAAAQSGRAHLVLGAFGCGAFGNPAPAVAAMFREQLASPAFRGRFATVVFAILDPLGTGNLKPFQRELASSKWPTPT